MPEKTLKWKNIYQLKITLIGSKPPIWRRFQVSDDITLQRLDGIIQIVMGWENAHLHQFVINGEEYGKPDKEFDKEINNEKKFTMGEIIVREKQRFEYQYDFGDDWRHDLLVEKIFPAEPDWKHPVVLVGARACPPEDCGGIWGYMDMLEIMSNPKHERYDEIMDWTGGEFDPEAFPMDEINTCLKKSKSPPRLW